MPRRSGRVHLNDMPKSESPGSVSLARKHITREEFGKRVYDLMLRKGWTQSELARQAGMNRDPVSNYIRGNYLPTPQMLQKLAKALDVDPNDLLPNYMEEAYDMAKDTSLEVKASADDPGMSWVKLNRQVRTGTVLKIMQALEEDGAATKSGK